MKCYQLEGINRKTQLKECIYVNAESKEIALQQAQTFADSVIYIKEHNLGENWK